MLHNPKMMSALKKQMMDADPNSIIEMIANLAASSTAKMVMEIEGQTGRDISPKAELGMTAIASEELVTIAQQFGLKPTKAMVANIVEIAANNYNRMIQGKEAAQ